MNFGGPRLRKIPHFEPPNFCWVYFIFYIYPFQKLGPSSCNGLKVQIFGGLVSGGSLILVPPNFVKFHLFFIFAYPKNFMCLALMVKKLLFWWSHLMETPILVFLNFVKFYLSFIFTYLENFMCLVSKVKKFEF